MAQAVTTAIRFTSRASVKIGDNFYTVEACEERMIPEDKLYTIDMELERKDLWDTVNTECDNQIQDILQTFKR